MKFGKRITIEEFEKLLAQDYGFLMKSQDDILQEFYHRLTSECLKPNVKYPISGNHMFMLLVMYGLHLTA